MQRPTVARAQGEMPAEWCGASELTGILNLPTSVLGWLKGETGTKDWCQV